MSHVLLQRRVTPPTKENADIFSYRFGRSADRITATKGRSESRTGAGTKRGSGSGSSSGSTSGTGS